MSTWGYASGALGSVAPFVAGSFGLDDAGMAGLTAWLGLAALGALGLGSAADRLGRRRVWLLCAFALPIGCGLTALAPNPVAYLAAQLVTQAAGATLAATAAVLLAEGLPTGERARGQGRAGLAFAIATALPLLALLALGGWAEPWRAVWALGALPLLAWPWLRGRLAESTRWQTAAAAGEARGRIGEVFRGAHRERAAGVLVAMVLVGGVEVSTRAWLFYHPVRALGLDPRVATLVLLVGGGVGLSGFRLGAWLSDRIGRRRTFAWAAALSVLGSAGYFGTAWLPAGRVPCLTVSLALLATAGNATTVSFRAIATELVPTRLRGAVAGSLAVGTALGWLLSMTCIAAWAPLLGGIGPAVVAFSLLALPAASLALARLPETAGLSLEVAAAEELRGSA